MTLESFLSATGAVAVLLTYLVAVFAGVRVAARRRERKPHVGFPRQRGDTGEPDLVVLLRAYAQGRVSQADYERMRSELEAREEDDESPAPSPPEPAPPPRQRGGRHRAGR